MLEVGEIYKQGEDYQQYRVQSINELQVIVNHFNNYPLITKKLADYELFKQAIQLIQQKEHLTEHGLYKLVAIKASMNLGLSDELKAAFTNITPVVRPLVQNLPIPDPN